MITVIKTVSLVVAAVPVVAVSFIAAGPVGAAVVGSMAALMIGLEAV